MARILSSGPMCFNGFSEVAWNWYCYWHKAKVFLRRVRDLNYVKFPTRQMLAVEFREIQLIIDKKLNAFQLKTTRRWTEKADG